MKSKVKHIILMVLAAIVILPSAAQNSPYKIDDELYSVYAEKGSITLAYRMVDDAVEFSVTDTGDARFVFVHPIEIKQFQK